MHVDVEITNPAAMALGSTKPHVQVFISGGDGAESARVILEITRWCTECDLGRRTSWNTWVLNDLESLSIFLLRWDNVDTV